MFKLRIPIAKEQQNLTASEWTILEFAADYAHLAMGHDWLHVLDQVFMFNINGMCAMSNNTCFRRSSMHYGKFVAQYSSLSFLSCIFMQELSEG